MTEIIEKKRIIIIAKHPQMHRSLGGVFVFLRDCFIFATNKPILQRMTPLEQAHTYIDQNRLAEYFELMEEQVGENADLAHLEEIFIVEGIKAGFSDRLRALANKTLGEIDNLKFNEKLTKTLLEAIAPYSKEAQKKLEDFAQDNIKDWETKPKHAQRAKQIIAYSLVGVIGIQFSKLVAIGSEDNMDIKFKKYIEKCLFIAKRSLDLVNFSLLSKLWDLQKQTPIALQEEQKRVLRRFFERTHEPELQHQLTFLQTLYNILAPQPQGLPFPEMQHFATCFLTDHEFTKACQEMQKLQEEDENEQKQTVYTWEKCRQAETLLATFLQHLGFLANYKMASIKRIGYKHLRNNKPHYVHRYTALGIDNKANVDAQKYNYSPETSPTDAVLIYKDNEYQTGLNLFPFVIDYNALTFEQGAKVCFYQNALHEDSLEYVFLEDGSTPIISLENILQNAPHINDIIADREKYQKMNLDNVVLLFREAQHTLLPTEADE